ncbi:MAG TPA: hypothetical protein VGL59_12200 [Polyangia bacterium]|jgi:hypothetical protein
MTMMNLARVATVIGALAVAAGCNGGKSPLRTTTDGAIDGDNGATDADNSDGAVATPPPDFIW